MISHPLWVIKRESVIEILPMSTMAVNNNVNMPSLKSDVGSRESGVGIVSAVRPPCLFWVSPITLKQPHAPSPLCHVWEKGMVNP